LLPHAGLNNITIAIFDDHGRCVRNIGWTTAAQIRAHLALYAFSAREEDQAPFVSCDDGRSREHALICSDDRSCGPGRELTRARYQSAWRCCAVVLVRIRDDRDETVFENLRRIVDSQLQLMLIGTGWLRVAGLSLSLSLSLSLFLLTVFITGNAVKFLVQTSFLRLLFRNVAQPDCLYNYIDRLSCGLAPRKLGRKREG
jgi:hypothetical protein